MDIHNRLMLLAKKGGSDPSVSITLPLIHTSSEKSQNVTGLHDLVREADKRLSSINTAESKKVQHVLHAMAQDPHVTERYSDGIALLANGQEHHILPLFGNCTADVVVGRLFALTAVIAGTCRPARHWVLLLSKEHARLFLAENGFLKEIVTPLKDAAGNPVQGFPLTPIRPEDRVVQAVGKGDRGDLYLIAEAERFLRLVDSELQKVFAAGETLPVVVCAQAELHTMFEKITHHKESILTCIPHDYAQNMHVHTLQQDVALALEKYGVAREAEALEKLAESANIRRQACGVTHVWEMVHAGRVQALYVDPTFKDVGRVNPDNPANIQVFPEGSREKVDRITDIMIYETLRCDGLVHVVKPGSLKECSPVAAILRY